MKVTLTKAKKQITVPIQIFDIVIVICGIIAVIACFIVFQIYQNNLGEAEKAYKPIQPRGELIYTPKAN